MHPTMQIRIASEFVPNWIQHRSAAIPAWELALGPSRAGIDARRSDLGSEFSFGRFGLRLPLQFDHHD